MICKFWRRKAIFVPSFTEKIITPTNFATEKYLMKSGANNLKPYFIKGYWEKKKSKWWIWKNRMWQYNAKHRLFLCSVECKWKEIYRLQQIYYFFHRFVQIEWTLWMLWKSKWFHKIPPLKMIFVWRKFIEFSLWKPQKSTRQMSHTHSGQVEFMNPLVRSPN